ncbi:IS3 family transposase [Wenyingzhuangia sp. IMCC45574]
MENIPQKRTQKDYSLSFKPQVVRTHAQQEQQSITATCKLLGVNRQVYYRDLQRLNHRQSLANQVVELVKTIRIQMPRIGTRKLYHILKTQLSTLKVGRDKLFHILKTNNMLIYPKRKYHVTTNSHHRFKKHKNRVKELEITRPNQAWVSDITYTGDRDNPSYLALITDAYSKKIVGYDLSKSLNVSGSIRALEMAIENEKYINEPLIHHSDRGLQYCSNEYQKLLVDNQIETSMTEQYAPYENAIAERVNGVLKQEFTIDIRDVEFENRKELTKNLQSNKTTLVKQFINS